MAKVTGLGGVFYVAKDPAATRKWYADTLGLTGEYGPQLAWADEPHEKPYSLISHFPDDQYIQPGTGGFKSNLFPPDGRTAVGMGVTYTQDNFKLQAGLQHVWFGDGTTQLGGAPAGEFTDNTAVAFGMKAGFTF